MARVPPPVAAGRPAPLKVTSGSPGSSRRLSTQATTLAGLPPLRTGLRLVAEMQLVCAEFRQLLDRRVILSDFAAGT